MNLGELILEVRSQLDDPIEIDDSDALWKDAEIQSYINEAEREVAIRTDCIVDASTTAICTIDIIATVDSYAISPLILRVKSLCLDSNNCVLSKVDASDIIWRCATKREGTPSAYTLGKEGGKLWFDSIPDQTDTASLVVSRLPLQDLTCDTDVPEIPVQYHLKMLEWVKYLSYGKHDSEVYDPKSRDLAERNFFNYFGSPFDAQEQERRLHGGEINWTLPEWGDNSYENRRYYFW